VTRFARGGSGGMRCRLFVLVPALSALSAISAVSAVAQAPTTPPTVPPPAGLRLPPIQQATLANGLSIRLVAMHEVPLVQVTLRVKGGGRLDGDLPGLASFTANLLDEGAGNRDAFGIAEQAAFLGAELGTGADWDYLVVTLNTPKRTLGEALDLMADVALRPTFKAADVARERELRLAQIIQQRDQPGGMAALAFGAIVFPAGHPYHRPLAGDSAAVGRLDSATVRRFYHQVFRPDQAELVITGDVTIAEARTEITRRFGRWIQNRMAVLRPPVPPVVPRPERRTVELVDKPGAAQSVIMIGSPGVGRTNPDYPALEVMNTILGGSFSSRLNQNLRETRGYTYGAGSGFTWRPVPGPFTARAAVRTDATDSSLVEFFRELNAIRDSLVSDAELDRARNYIVFGLPGEFETTGQMAGQVADLLTFGLPPTYLETFVGQVMKVRAADVQRVAQQYFDPARVHVVVVGDVEKIRSGIEALGLGPVTLRDLEGRPVRQ
jgi:zinc protease